jgi:adenosylhomocysteinase
VNVAVSPLRRVEALVAGDAVALAADALLRAQGWTLAGRRVLVAGYGPVGRGTARALRRRDAVVGVYDPDPLRLVEAKVEGFLTPALREWIPQVSLMVGAAGALSVTAGVIALLPDGAAIAAGGPGGEIDLAALHARAEESEPVAEGVRRFRMRDGRALLLLGEGAPFALAGGSTPGEVAELGHAEVLLLVHELATREHPAGVASIDPALSAIPAQAWLEARDPHFRALAAAA